MVNKKFGKVHVTSVRCWKSCTKISTLFRFENERKNQSNTFLNVEFYKETHFGNVDVMTVPITKIREKNVQLENPHIIIWKYIVR